MNKSEFRHAVSSRPRPARSFCASVALVLLAGASGAAGAACGPGQACAKTYEDLVGQYLRVTDGGYERDAAVLKTEGEGCDMIENPAFRADASRCLKGDDRVCAALGRWIGGAAGDPWRGEDECAKTVRTFAERSCEAGRDCAAMFALDDDDATATLLKQADIEEKRCLAKGPDAAFSCLEALHLLVGGGNRYPPEKAPLRGERNGAVLEFNGGSFAIYRIEPGTYRDPARIERLFKAGCDAGVKLYCRKMVFFAPVS